MEPQWQEVADWIAANLTAAALRELAAFFDLGDPDLEGVSRQAAAESLTRTLGAGGRFVNLQGYLADRYPDFPFPPPGTLSSESRIPAAEPPPERVVSTGFADPLNPGLPARPNIPLETGARYFFWLQIGAPVAGSIETAEVVLDTSELPPDARLTVALFAYPGELLLTPGQDVGQLQLNPDGTITVGRPAAAAEEADEDLRASRLFFPVETPATPGVYRLRCHIYYEQILLQSRVVTARVSSDPEPGRDAALTAETDFILSRQFSPTQLAPLPPHRLSLLLNDNDGATHGLRFWGEGEFKNDSALDAGELQNLIDLVRGALRQAAWGDEEEYEPAKPYLYDGPLDLKRLRVDLLRMAIRGYRMYDVLINRLAGGREAVDRLQALMRRPGHIQLAARQHVRLVIPAAMIYDYWLDTGLKASEYRFCPEFESWLQAGKPLSDCPCFQGDCPTVDEDDVVCPSGFWGFRHALGVPVTLPNSPDAPAVLPAGAGPELAVAVSTDPNFTGREAHEAALRKLHPHLIYHYANERPETIELMQKRSPHVFYFFCHGRLSADTPALEVGPPGTRGISRDNLRSKRIRWEKIRPLVFLNGCHTTALSPDRAIDLVSGFVDTAAAAGVIGTEIVNFVPLARTFAEEMLRRFFAGEPIGEAVRAGRLAVLQQGNPLGLIFVPFVMSGLKLESG